jgi:hypothetical protein
VHGVARDAVCVFFYPEPLIVHNWRVMVDKLYRNRIYANASDQTLNRIVLNSIVVKDLDDYSANISNGRAEPGLG